MGRTIHSILRKWAVEHVAVSSAELRAWRDYNQDTGFLQLLLYFAVCTSNSKLVHRLLDEMGHNCEAPPCTVTAAGIQSTPVLALAVMQHDHQMVKQLLDRGADPYAIPAQFYLPAMRDEGMHGLPWHHPTEAGPGKAASWCVGSGDSVRLQEALSPAVNCGLKMCYWLARATKVPRLTQL